MPDEEQKLSSVVSEVRKGAESLGNRLDELLSPLYFQELVELAEEVCLTHPPFYPEAKEPTGEASLVYALGARGLRVATELTAGFITVSPTESRPEEDQDKIFFTINSPLQYPEHFNNSMNPEVISKVEAFGAQLIKESFHTLGQDAYQKAEQFRRATTSEEQMVIIEWLNTRLRAMIDNDLAPITGEETVYHPSRLSPKLIGSYPTQHLKPTCLSVSTIATSFFQRAGAEVLHGEVVESGKDNCARITRSLIQKILHGLNKYDVTFSDTARESLEKIKKQAGEYYEREESHHVAVYVKLADNSWAQFDSNYHATTQLEKGASEEIDKVQSQLADMRPYAPNLELSTHLPQGTYIVAAFARLYIEAQSPELVDGLRRAAEIELRSESELSLAERVYRAIDTIFFAQGSDSDLLKEISLFLHLSEVRRIDGEYEDHLYNVFYKLFSKYVLWDESIDEVKERSKNDASYYQNRVDDIVALPFMMLAGMARDELSLGEGGRGAHSVVDLGNPEYRIGIATLSEFASYTDSPLTPSFWLSHWPGTAALIENLEHASHSRIDDAYLFNNLGHYTLHPLTSSRNKGIIESFFALRDNSRSDDGDSGQG